jgi:hypothetical protein
MAAIRAEILALLTGGSLSYGQPSASFTDWGWLTYTFPSWRLLDRVFKKFDYEKSMLSHVRMMIA